MSPRKVSRNMRIALQPQSEPSPRKPSRRHSGGNQPPVAPHTHPHAELQVATVRSHVRVPLIEVVQADAVFIGNIGAELAAGDPAEVVASGAEIWLVRGRGDDGVRRWLEGVLTPVRRAEGGSAGEGCGRRHALTVVTVCVHQVQTRCREGVRVVALGPVLLGDPAVLCVVADD